MCTCMLKIYSSVSNNFEVRTKQWNSKTVKMNVNVNDIDNFTGLTAWWPLLTCKRKEQIIFVSSTLIEQLQKQRNFVSLTLKLNNLAEYYLTNLCCQHACTYTKMVFSRSNRLFLVTVHGVCQYIHIYIHAACRQSSSSYIFFSCIYNQLKFILFYTVLCYVLYTFYIMFHFH